MSMIPIVVSLVLTVFLLAGWLLSEDEKKKPGATRTVVTGFVLIVAFLAACFMNRSQRDPYD